MNRPSRWDVTQGVLARTGATAFVVCCLAVVLTVTGGAVAGQEVDISVQPDESEVEVGEETTLEVVVVGASDGVGVYDIEVDLADGDVAEITNVTFVKEPLPLDTVAEVRDNGTTAVGVAAMGDNAYDGPEAAVLELTVRGTTADAATELTVAEGSAVGNASGTPYDIDERPAATVAVVETGPGDGDGETNGGDGDMDGDGGDGDMDGDGGDGDMDGDGGDGGTDGDGGTEGDGGDGLGPGFGAVSGLVAVFGAGALLFAVGRRGGDAGND
jgi:hypothetical protein